MPVIKYKDENGVTHKLPVVAAMDTELSLESTNGVQNKVITNALNNVGDVDKYTNLIKLSKDNICHLSFDATTLVEKPTAYSVIVECEGNTDYYIMKPVNELFKAHGFDAMPEAGMSYDIVDEVHSSDGYKISTTDTMKYILIEFYNGTVENDAMEIFKNLYICIGDPILKFDYSPKVLYQNVLHPTALSDLTYRDLTCYAKGEIVRISGTSSTNGYYCVYNGQSAGYGTISSMAGGYINPGRYVVHLKFIRDYQNSDGRGIHDIRYACLVDARSTTHTLRNIYDGSVVDVAVPSMIALRSLAGVDWGDKGIYVDCRLEKVGYEESSTLEIKQAGQLSEYGYRYQSASCMTYFNNNIVVTSHVGQTTNSPSDAYSEHYGGVEMLVYNDHFDLIDKRLFTVENFQANDNNPTGMRGELRDVYMLPGYSSSYLICIGYSTYDVDKHDSVLFVLSSKYNISKYKVNPFGEDFVATSRPLLTPSHKIIMCGYNSDNAAIVYSDTGFSSDDFYNLTYTMISLAQEDESQWTDCTIGYNQNKLYCVAHKLPDEGSTTHGMSVFVTSDVDCKNELGDLTLLKTLTGTTKTIRNPQLLPIDDKNYLTIVGGRYQTLERRDLVVGRFYLDSQSCETNEIIANENVFGGYCYLTRKNDNEYYVLYSHDGLNRVDVTDMSAYELEVNQSDELSYSIYSSMYLMPLNMNALLSGKDIEDINHYSIEEVNAHVDDLDAEIQFIQDDQLNAMYELFAADMQKWLPAVYGQTKKYYTTEMYTSDSFQDVYQTVDRAKALQVGSVTNAYGELNQYVDVDNLLDGFDDKGQFSITQQVNVDDESILTTNVHLSVPATTTTAVYLRLHKNGTDPLFLIEGHKYYFPPLSNTVYITYTVWERPATGSGSSTRKAKTNTGAVVQCEGSRWYVTLTIETECLASERDLHLSVIDLTAIFGAGNEPDFNEASLLYDLSKKYEGRLNGVTFNSAFKKIFSYNIMNQAIANSRCIEGGGYIESIWNDGTITYDDNGVTIHAADHHYHGFAFNGDKISFYSGEKYLVLLNYTHDHPKGCAVCLSNSQTQNALSVPQPEGDELARRIINVTVDVSAQPRVVSRVNLQDGETFTVKTFYLVNLTKMFGVGHEPVAIDDPRVDEIVTYLEEHPEANKTGFVLMNSVSEFEVPDAVTSMDGYGEGDPVTGVYNELDLNYKRLIKYGHYVDEIWTPFADPQIVDLRQYIPYDVIINSSQSKGICFADENDEPIFTKSTIDYLIKN